LSDQTVDLVFSVAEVTTFNEVIRDTSVTSSWAGELEGPQEVVGSLEVWSNGKDFVDQIFDRLDTTFGANFILNDSIVGKGDSLAIDLAMSTLVDQFSDSLQIWITPGDEWLSIRISTSNRENRY